MPKKKTNVEVESTVVEAASSVYDTELIYDDAQMSHSSRKVMARKVVPYGEFLNAVDGVIESVFTEGYSPATVPYVFNANLITLFTDYSSLEPEDILREVFVYHLSDAIYNFSDMAVAFKKAVMDGIEYQQNRSPLYSFFEKLNSIDLTKLENVLKNLSGLQLSKDDITKAIVEATKG